jgi:GNAT superfamily N-acetyltransferase
LSIRAAEARDAEALPTLENSAGTLFRNFPSLEWLADGEDLSVDRYRELIAAGASWVVVDPDDQPIAFLSGTVEENDLHIWELGVRRDLQRFGIGRNLLLAAIRDARRHSLAAVTLTTFRDVPWNAPFYARLGFECLAGEAIGDRLERVLSADATRGLPMHARCAMRLRLS